MGGEHAADRAQALLHLHRLRQAQPQRPRLPMQRLLLSQAAYAEATSGDALLPNS